MINENKPLLAVEHIVSVKKQLKKQHSSYNYKEQLKFFGFITRKEGYYFDFIDSTYTTKEEIEKDEELFCENKKVYFKPRLVIDMVDESRHFLYFNSEKELLETLDKIFAKFL